MDRQEKADILLNTARAYLARGSRLQYDQLSMDRLVRCSPRRSAFAPPEMATAQRYMFIDCSSFVWDTYYQTFGYRLPADLTWHMIDVLPCRVFYYELTHEESPEEQQAICEQVRSLLQPGDIVTFDRGNHIGHTMLYEGNGRFIHSTQRHGFNGYHYKERRNIFDPTGTVCEDTCDRWFTPWDGGEFSKLYLLRDDNKRFSVHRPLDMLGDPTPQALIRFGAAKDLFCSVLTAPGPGHCVENGGTLSYTAVVENRGEEAKTVSVRFEAGTGSQAEGLAEKTMELKPGETGSCVFYAKACAERARIEPPRITVNGLAVWAPRVNVGGSANGSPAPESFSMAPEEVSGRLHDLFFLHDTELADVVSRRPQDPAQDGCAYGLYGGLGVISPQNATGADIRETYLDETYLEPGDILLVADDALFLKSYACLWTGKELIGQFEAEGEAGRKAGEDARVWIDSLPGRFCFAVLRPALQKEEAR